MKKLLTTALILTFMLLCLLGLTVATEAATQSGTCGAYLTWSLDTETGELNIEGTGAMTDYPFAFSVDYPKAPWHSYRSLIKSVDIAEGVTHIGDWAFYECENVLSMTIPSSLTSIGNHAFYDCSLLTSITLGEDSQLTSIGEYAFNRCYNLGSITVPESVTSIEEGAFSSCYGLESITIPESVMSIGKGAFSSCDYLESIYFLSPTTEIYDSASTIYVTISDVTIYGLAGSTAQAYAEKYGERFVELPAFTKGLAFTLNSEDTAYSVTGYHGEATEVLIPISYLGLPVTELAGDIFGTVALEDEYKGDLSGGIVMPDDDFLAVEPECLVEQITFMSPSIVLPNSASAIPASVTLCGYRNSTAHAYAETYGREFIFLPEIYSASVGLGSDITVTFIATMSEDEAANAVMTFTAGGRTSNVLPVAMGAGRYAFAFEGINPQMMGNTITAELTVDGTSYDVVENYSVRQYCLNMLAKVESGALTTLSAAKQAALGTLLRDMLEYGAASQRYVGYNTSALVNAGITGASEFVPLTADFANKGPVTITPAADGTSFVSARVELFNVLRLYFEFKTTNVAAVTIKVGNMVFDKDDFTLVKTVNDGFGVATEHYDICSDAIYATQFEKDCVVTLCVDGVECQSLTYSVVNYIYNMQNSTADANLTALLKRIRCYGLSAEAYATAQ